MPVCYPQVRLRHEPSGETFDVTLRGYPYYKRRPAATAGPASDGGDGSGGGSTGAGAGATAAETGAGAAVFLPLSHSQWYLKGMRHIYTRFDVQLGSQLYLTRVRDGDAAAGGAAGAATAATSGAVPVLTMRFERPGAGARSGSAMLAAVARAGLPPLPRRGSLAGAAAAAVAAPAAGDVEMADAEQAAGADADADEEAEADAEADADAEAELGTASGAFGSNICGDTGADNHGHSGDTGGGDEVMQEAEGGAWAGVAAESGTPQEAPDAAGNDTGAAAAAAAAAAHAALPRGAKRRAEAADSAGASHVAGTMAESVQDGHADPDGFRCGRRPPPAKRARAETAAAPPTDTAALAECHSIGGSAGVATDAAVGAAAAAAAAAAEAADGPAAGLAFLHGCVPPAVGLPPLRPGELRLCGLTFHPDLAPAVLQLQASWLEKRSKRGEAGLLEMDPASVQIQIPEIEEANQVEQTTEIKPKEERKPEGAVRGVVGAHGLSPNVICSRLARVLGLSMRWGAPLPQAPPPLVDGVVVASDPERGGLGLAAAKFIRKSTVLGVLGGYVLPAASAAAAAAAGGAGGTGWLPAPAGASAAEVFVARGFQELAAPVAAELAARAEPADVAQAWRFLAGSFRAAYPGLQLTPAGDTGASWRARLLRVGCTAFLESVHSSQTRVCLFESNPPYGVFAQP